MWVLGALVWVVLATVGVHGVGDERLHSVEVEVEGLGPLRLAPHPRLRLTDARLAEIRSLVASEPLAGQAYARLVARAEALLTAPFVDCHKAGVESSLLSAARNTLDRVYTLGFLYRFSRNATFARRGIAEALNACLNCTTWNPPHFLDVGEFTHALGIAFDWFYPELSAAERAIITNATATFGLGEGLKGYATGAWWATTEMNWNLVCNGGLAIGALAFAEEAPNASAAVLAHATKNIPNALATYAPHGGWPESETYWGYATKYFLAVTESMATAQGTDHGWLELPGTLETGLYRIYGTGPTQQKVAWGDGDPDAEDEFQVNLLGLASHAPAPLAKVYAAAGRALLAAPNTHQGQENAALALMAYSTAGAPGDVAALPLSRSFSFSDDAWEPREGESSVCFIRSAWLDPNASFVAVRGGSGQTTHNDLDAGSFVLDMAGRRFAHDLGADDYGLPQYFSMSNEGRYRYYRKATAGHNTLMFNCHSAEPRHCNQNDTVVSYLDLCNGTAAGVDLSAAYAVHGITHAHRTVAFAPGFGALVVDDEFVGAASVNWTMHTHANVSVATGGHRAELDYGGVRLTALLDPRTAPPGLAFTTAEAHVDPPQRSLAGTYRLMLNGATDPAGQRLTVCLGPGIASCP